MKNKLHDAFRNIHAEEKLKQDTYAFLQNKVYRKKKQMPHKKYLFALASAVLLFVVCFSSYSLYFTASAVIDIDVNPSIELTLNRFDRVIAEHAYNEDGQRVLESANIRHKSYAEALQVLLKRISEMGYMEKGGLVTTLQSTREQKETEFLDKMKEQLESLLESGRKLETDEIFVVDADTKMYSHQHNLTPAKYLAILELQKYDPTITFDSCRDHSISEVKEQTHRHQGMSGHGNHGTQESEKERNTSQSGDYNRHGRAAQDDKTTHMVPEKKHTAISENRVNEHAGKQENHAESKHAENQNARTDHENNKGHEMTQPPAIQEDNRPPATTDSPGRHKNDSQEAAKGHNSSSDRGEDHLSGGNHGKSRHP